MILNSHLNWLFSIIDEVSIELMLQIVFDKSINVISCKYTGKNERSQSSKDAFTINGREEKLKTDDGKYIPLYFDAKNWYEPEVVFHNIERKMKFLQLGADFSLEIFKNRFLALCEQDEKNYGKLAKKQKITKTDEKIVDEDSLHALREKWDAKYSKSKK